MTGTNDMRIGAMLVLLAATWIAAVSPAMAQHVHDGFYPNPDGVIFGLAVQADGRLIVGGNFSQIDFEQQTRLARLHGDGSLDTSFSPAIGNGLVTSVAVQADGKIVAAGTFTDVGEGAPMQRIARFLADGSVDPEFSASVSSQINAVVVQEDGGIVIGGTFSSVNGEPRARIARLLPNGNLDPDFNPGANRTVRTLALQEDGKILVGGRFLTIDGQPHVSIARLHPDGSLDTDFVAEANGPVNAIAVAFDGSVVIGGEFSAVSGAARQRLARVDRDGNLDPSFEFDANGKVWALRAAADGSLLVGGEFTTLGTGIARGIGSLYFDVTDGVFRIREQFEAEILDNDPIVRALAIQPDSKIVLGGRWNELNGNPSIRNLGRVTSLQGFEDFHFAATGRPGGAVRAIAASNGAILIGGDFLEFDGDAKAHVAKLLVTGELDGSFQADTDGQVNALFVSPLGGKALVGGEFFAIDGLPRTSLAQIDIDDGQVSAEFAPQLENGLESPVVHAITTHFGDVLVAGEFSSVEQQARGNIVRFAGSSDKLDHSFRPYVNGPVHAIAVDTLGRVVVGGDFSSVDGEGRSNIARLLADGSLDAGFDPGADGPVLALAVHPDGAIWVGGSFHHIAGQSHEHLALLQADGSDSGIHVDANAEVYSLALYADGRVLAGGHFSQVAGANRTLLARLFPDGQVDQSLHLPIDNNGNGSIYALALQTDGKVLLGGNFTDVGNAWAENLARLNEPTPALTRLVFENRRLAWQRSGSAPAFSGSPELYILSADPAGRAERIRGGLPMLTRSDGQWVSPPLPLITGLPTMAIAFGKIASGLHGGSGGIAAGQRLIFLPDAIFADGFE